MQLAERRKEFEALGVHVAAMTYDGTAVLQTFSAETGIGFPLLSDAAGENGPVGAGAISLGILNEEYEEGHPAHGIAHPGIFFIDAAGAIRGKWAQPDYRERPPFEDVLSGVRETLAADAAAQGDPPASS